MPRKTINDFPPPVEGALVRVENRGPGAFQIELTEEDAPEGWGALYLGDPADRGRKTDKGEDLPQPEVQVPEDVWAAYMARHGGALQGMIERGSLVVR